MNVSTTDILAITATIAGLLMAISPVLQIRRMFRTRSSNDVSLLYLSMLCAGFFAWIAYGWALGNPAMLISNTASITFMSLTILVALRFRRAGAKRAAAGAAALKPVPVPAAGPGDAPSEEA
jgi:MtN3 and saliva related transmembrane protein